MNDSWNAFDLSLDALRCRPGLGQLRGKVSLRADVNIDCYPTFRHFWSLSHIFLICQSSKPCFL